MSEGPGPAQSPASQDLGNEAAHGMAYDDGLFCEAADRSSKIVGVIQKIPFLDPDAVRPSDQRRDAAGPG